MKRTFDDFTGLEGTEENRLYPVSVFVADQVFFKLDLSKRSLGELVEWVQGGRDRTWEQFGREDPDPIRLEEERVTTIECGNVPDWLLEQYPDGIPMEDIRPGIPLAQGAFGKPEAA